MIREEWMSPCYKTETIKTSWLEITFFLGKRDDTLRLISPQTKSDRMRPGSVRPTPTVIPSHSWLNTRPNTANDTQTTEGGHTRGACLGNSTSPRASLCGSLQESFGVGNLKIGHAKESGHRSEAIILRRYWKASPIKTTSTGLFLATGSVNTHWEQTKPHC